MKNYTLPYYGTIDFDNMESEYYANMTLSNDQIELELNLLDDTIDLEQLDAIKIFLNNIEHILKKPKFYIEHASADGSDEGVEMYVDHHLQEFNNETLKEILAYSHPDTDLKTALIKALRPVRISIDIEDTEHEPTVVIDYTIDPDKTQYILVCETKLDGSVLSTSMES
ncbi:DUF2004 domain-containing protein [Edaphocola flava]|jgi:hypothetical protein|uniref:DUF2004 domain-containing protein n=1 Tax=Edaphocola flava TaxID=2499629 RepID=UPI00100BF751|nr:DUF2004 domain-containing protein [Edaphocola flava]